MCARPRLSRSCGTHSAGAYPSNAANTGAGEAVGEDERAVRGDARGPRGEVEEEPVARVERGVPTSMRVPNLSVAAEV